LGNQQGSPFIKGNPQRLPSLMWKHINTYGIVQTTTEMAYENKCSKVQSLAIFPILPAIWEV